MEEARKAGFSSNVVSCCEHPITAYYAGLSTIADSITIKVKVSAQASGQHHCCFVTVSICGDRPSAQMCYCNQPLTDLPK